MQIGQGWMTFEKKKEFLGARKKIKFWQIDSNLMVHV